MDGLLSQGGGGLLGGMTEEEAKNLMNSYYQNMVNVPFGSQQIGGAVRPVANYAQAPMGPSMQPPAAMPTVPASNPFMAALQYQSNLPFAIRGFNPADIPATYQQVAPPQRLDWSKVTVPQWLQDAINSSKSASAPASTSTGVKED